MSAPAVIDSLQFARAGQSLRGLLPLATLKRLEDVLFDPDGELVYELRGGHDPRRRPQLELSVRGVPHLQCQRCLGCLDYDLEVRSALLLVPPGTPADDDLEDPEAPDLIEASAELDVAALIEDEVLLSLPLAPRHPDGACASHAQGSAGAELRTAFARLAGLKRPTDKI